MNRNKYKLARQSRQKQREQGYTKTIIAVLVSTLLLIPRTLKYLTVRQLSIYWSGLFIIGIVWTLIVNNVYPDQAWTFTRTSILGCSFLNIVLEDYLFYLCAPIIFLSVFISFPNVYRFPVWLALAILPITILFAIESYVGVAMFVFVAPLLFLCVENKWKINWCSFLLLTPSTLWDWASTNYLYHWTYPEYIYQYWLFNSPLVITPWFSIIGILLGYQWFFYVRRTF